MLRSLLNPLLHVLATQPELLGEHAQAYVELLSAEVSRQARAVGRRTLLMTLAVCFLGVTAVLCGTVWLLWTVFAPQMTTVPVAMVVVPLIPAVIALGFFWAAWIQPSSAKGPLTELRRQAQADMALLREMGAL